MNKKNTLILFTSLITAITIIALASLLFRVYMSFPIGMSPIKALSNFHLTEQVRSHVFDIFYYQKHYSELYPKQLKWAWLGSLIIHGLLVFIISKLAEKKQSLYGDARFATYSEIQKSKLFIKRPSVKLPKNLVKHGLFAGKHIIVGKLGNQYIGLGDQQFVYLAAPTRSGKGVGVVIPVGLSYDHSMVVLDIKQELFNITAAFRAKCGQAVYLFNPFDPEGRTACWNPLSYVSRSETQRVDDVNQIAICLIPDSTGDDNFFNESARKLFIGLALYCFDKEKDSQGKGIEYRATIRDILDLATDFNHNNDEEDDGEAKEAITHFSRLMTEPFVSKIAMQSINSAVSAGDKTFASILATLTANLTPWLSEPVAHATSRDDFDLRKVRKERMSIYIGIQPKDLAKAKKIINLFYSQLINENTGVLPENDSSLKYQCLMLMDEGTSPGRIAVLEKAVSYMAGYNMRMLFIAQSPAQLQDRAVYGEHGARNILTNIALKVLYKPNDIADSEEYSKLLGKTTIKEDTQKSRGGGSKGISYTETQNQRDLMLPQELREMSKDKEIIIFEGISHPIMAEKNQYYSDPVFMARFLPFKGKARVLSIEERAEFNHSNEIPKENAQSLNKKMRSYITSFQSNIQNTLTDNIPVDITVSSITYLTKLISESQTTFDT